MEITHKSNLNDTEFLSVKTVENRTDLLRTLSNQYVMVRLCKIKEYQKHMENFDQNVDHITKWIIHADTLLDESEKKKPQQKEDVLKVTNKTL